MRLTIGLFVLIRLSCVAQDGNTIQTEIDLEKNDSIRVDLLLKAAWNIKSSQPNLSHTYIDQAIEISEGSSNKKQLASAFYYKSAIYYLTSKYDSALLLSGKAILIYEGLQDSYGMASIYNLRGLLQEKIGDYSQAIKNYQLSLSFAAKTDNLYGQSNPLHNIGLIYNKTEDHAASLDYFEKALIVRKQIGDSVLIAQSFQSIGMAHGHLGDTSRSIGYQKKAIAFFKAKEDWYDLALCYINLGDLYSGLKKYDSAELLLRESIRLNTEIDNPEGRVKALINLSSIQLGKKEFNKALTFANGAITLAKEYNLRPELKLAYINRSASYEGLKNFEAAFQTQQDFIALSDSLLNDEKVQTLTQMETRYQVKEKEQQIALQETELERNYFLIVGLSIVLSLLIIIVLLARGRFQRKQQIALKEKEIAVKEAFIDATIQSQERERKRFAQDLHDGMGQLISSLRLMINQVDRNLSLEERVLLMERSENILSEMHKEIRSIAFNLMPQTLIQFGLVPALNEMALRVNETKTVLVTISSFDMPDRLQEVQEISLYRILQEWISNVMKHADASKIEVQIVGHEDEIAITIEDNGKGFDQNKLQQGKGNGWKNIQSRIHLIKGSVEIDSNANHRGTTLLIKVPQMGVLKEQQDAVLNTQQHG